MKDTQVKPVLSTAKSKSSIKKEKPPKKMKEPKVIAPKSPKGKKKTIKETIKKPKIKKEKIQPVPRRRRGRPRNEDKVESPKKRKVSPKLPKNAETKPASRKRKLPQNTPSKNDKDHPHSASKKQKTNDNSSMNGTVKTSHTMFKPIVIKTEPIVPSENSDANSMASNGTFHSKNVSDACPKKPTGGVSKTVTFNPNTKTDVLNCNSVPKPLKSLPSNKSIKGILKTDTSSNYNSKLFPLIPPEEIKKEKASPPFVPLQSPVKHHPQRMASLDAMARMHVICIPDRKPPEHHSKTTTSSVVTVSSSEPFTKSVTQCHERILVDVKKESKDAKGNLVQKQINFVKEKQQVFVSHSVEQSKIISTKTEKAKKKAKTSPKPVANSASVKEHKNQTAKSTQAHPNNVAKKPKEPKGKKAAADKKSAKAVAKVEKVARKLSKDKTPATKAPAKKSKKLEQTKSEVKVKETIRMQKTCTYQSVTTVNSHGATNSSVVPVSHVGMTTNYSKTKKTVVTDEESKNKINYSGGSLMNNTYCVTSDSPCAGTHSTDCCKFHSHSSPQVIPFAHMQTCSLTHGVPRTTDTPSSPSRCDGNCSIHRFGHQQAVIYSPPSPDYGCCCPNTLVQNVHDPCLLRKGLLTYPHSHQHHSRHSSGGYSPEHLCSEFHPGSSSPRHLPQHFALPSTSHSRLCCNFCELHREGSQHCLQSSCLQYLSPSKNSTGLVPCEQSPLDLSLTSTSSSSSMDSPAEVTLTPGHCPSNLCCGRDMVVLRAHAPHAFHNCPAKKTCCGFSNKQNLEATAVHPLQCSSKSATGQSHPPLEVAACSGAGAAEKSSVVVPPSTPVAGKEGVAVPPESLAPAKQEKSLSPKQKGLVPKKKQFAHGWSWRGRPRERLIALTNDSAPCPRLCFPSVEHKEGDVIKEKDCVLLRSGPKDTDLPYVAKVAAFWENPEDGEMMMSLLWYYRPEHTDQGRKPGQMEDEVFASRHKDVNSIACIEDKCYVMTYSEYCRYRAMLSMDEDCYSLSAMVVPDLPDGYPRKARLPTELVAGDIVFFCRHVYDFRQKRILKNPT